ncbi:MAG TPA: tyrosine-type recombinase/integrase [Verrucomicrobiae bacterium]|nr:tyrosine-type recombinase/integrase [Verrucomicrobiae bacterium]
MNTDQTTIQKTAFERIGESIYRKGGTIYARVRINGRLTWRSTETNEPAKARKWLAKWRNEEWTVKNGFELQGVALHRQRVTVRELVAEYLAAGCPTRKMRSKSPATVRNEQFFLNPVRAYFGDKIASSVTLADCDKYRDWRLSGGYVSSFKVRGGHLRTVKTKGGNRSVDLELTILSNVFNLAVRRNVLQSNPFYGRGRYSVASDVRHCREVAPTPDGLKKIEDWLRSRNEHAVADLVCFLAFSGLRIGEAVPLTWDAVNRGEQILHVTREKRGIMPWVPILREMEILLEDMEKRATGDLLFPSPFDPSKPRDISAIRHRITAACKKLEIGHVTPHGLRSYFVTQARQSGLTDAEIAALIGDKTGPAIIAHTYGDLRPDHLLAQAQRIRLTVAVPVAS